MVFRYEDTPQYILLHFIAEIIRSLARWMSQWVEPIMKSIGFMNTGADSTSDDHVLVDPAIQFYNTRLNRLLITYSEKYSTRSTIDWNSNISPVFYDKQKYKTTLEEYNNVLETEWKTRILLETTPRGNVIMHFDPYKMGFAYFSDHYVPYNVLNAIAMKYVLVYRCRDFFMDEFIIPETQKSPLLDLRRVEDKKKTETKEGTSSMKDDASAPFAKLKSYNKSASFSPTIASKVGTHTSNAGDKRNVEKIQLMNAFIHLGKLCNYSVIQKQSKKHTLNGFSTRFDAGKKISWAEYKKKQK